MAVAAFALAGCGGCNLSSATFAAPPITPIEGDRLCHVTALSGQRGTPTCIKLGSSDHTTVASHLQHYRSMIVQHGWEAMEHPDQFQRRSSNGRCVDFLAIGFAEDSILVTPTSRACGCDL
jgi:hypothetical protein